MSWRQGPPFLSDRVDVMAKATLGGGCFWCLEAVFQRRKGVVSVVSGYAGGTPANPTYAQVCSGTTGHAEVVQIEFDEKEISFDDLLDLFWRCHDPTTLNRQGADVGTQYRSVIFFHDEDQRRAAQASKKAMDEAAVFDSAIVTEILPLTAFYKAERHHQNYYNDNARVPYCTYVIRPKLEKLKLKTE